MLAAGGSSRLGHPKQLIEFQGAPLVRRAAEAARAAGARPVVIVVGADATRVGAVVHDLEDVIVCENPDWKSGMASSLITGLNAIQEMEAVDGVLFLLVDQPLVSPETLASLIESFTSGHRIVAASYEGIVGVPAVIGREYFKELFALSGDRGAGQWLRAQGSKVHAISVVGAGLDVDSPEDLEKLLGSND